MSQLVCYYCKLVKKKCDKRLPSCSRCARRGVECDYKARPKLTTGQELQILRNKFESLERSFYPSARRQRSGSPSSEILFWQQSKSNNPNVNPNSSQDYPQSTAEKYLPLISYPIGDENIHVLVYNHACRIFELGNTNFVAACDEYFETVHKWLPILKRDHIYDQIRHSTIDIPRGDWSILLIVIYLIIQLPAQPKPGASFENSLPIYSTIKALHVQVQALLPPSIHLLQAQLLIAAFEHGQGLVTASYLSIGACARACDILALNRQSEGVWNQCTVFSNEKRSTTDEESRLWWGCIIRDRKIHVENFFKSRRLAMAHPTLTDGLPPENISIEEGLTSNPPGCCCNVGSQNIKNSPRDQCSNAVHNVGAYGREAQAALLLSEVIDHVNELANSTNLPKESREGNCTRLDLELQSLLSLVIDQSAGTWSSYCGALAVTMSALFMLHNHQIAEQHSGLPTPPGQSDNPTTTFSVLALKALIRMIIQIAHQFNHNIPNFDVRAFPPCPIYAMFQAGLLHVKFRQENMDEATTVEWHRDLNELRECLWWQGQRWMLGLNYLEIIDRTCHFPLRQFENTNLPKGSLSGLC